MCAQDVLLRWAFFQIWFENQSCLHRHTGGLENLEKSIVTIRQLHRHTGGLESQIKINILLIHLHRHTGGLEMYKEWYKV